MRKKPAIGQIWYCSFNLAYFVIIGLDKDARDGVDLCKIKWTDTLEIDEIANRTLLTHKDFCYITG